MRKVIYCIPTYKSYDLAYEGIEAALNSSIPIDQVIVIDNSGNGAGAAYLQPLVDKYSNVFVWPQTTNIGVASSWNMFHDRIARDHIIIANDDVKVHHHTLEFMVEAAEKNPDTYLFAGDGSSGNAFSLFLLTHKGYHALGGFDANFYPAYYEDNDAARRLLLLGQTIYFVSGATYDHVGSSTLKRYTQQEMENHHNYFRKNTHYYLMKWGGKPHEEVYETPFDK